MKSSNRKIKKRPTVTPEEVLRFFGYSSGVVYTKEWVVDLILDLAGYTNDVNLVDVVAVEPAAGDGAFVIHMARRLIDSCRNQNRSLVDCAKSLIAYEIEEKSANMMRSSVIKAIGGMGVEEEIAVVLAESWVTIGDYLLDAPNLPDADFVMGNPPYVRLEEIPKDLVEPYRSLYPVMQGRSDLYVAFYEAALKQLKPDGVCAFICPHSWMLNHYGKELRRLVTSRFAVDFVVDVNLADPFDRKVKIYTTITVIRNKEQDQTVVAKFESNIKVNNITSISTELKAETNGHPKVQIQGLNSEIVDGWFNGSDPWPCSSPRHLELLWRLEEEFEPLESEVTQTKVRSGACTGLDSILIVKDKNLVERDRLIPLALAEDTRTGRLRWSGHYMISLWNGEKLVNLNDFPLLCEYLEKNQTGLEKWSIKDQESEGWYYTYGRVVDGLLEGQKIYIPTIKNYLNPVLDRGETYPGSNLCFIESGKWDLEVLGGLLLSKVCQFFIERYSVRMVKTFCFRPQYLRRIRVPDPREISEDLKNQLVDAFRKRDIRLATKAALKVYRIEPSEFEMK